MSIKSVAFDHPTSAGACGIGQAWARVPRRKAPTSSARPPTGCAACCVSATR